VNLKPLIVITGCVRAEGGETHSARQAAPQRAAAARRRRQGAPEQITVTHKRTVAPDRRAANVISTDYMRQLRNIRAIKTPYGTLVDAKQLRAVKEMIQAATRDVAEFNAAAAASRLSNCLMWEHLAGNRLAAVQGWIARRLRDGDEVVHSAITALTAVEDPPAE
jgi:hypothetical protein